MVGGGVPRLVVSKILNHVETGVTAVYDRHSYDGEKRAALDYLGQPARADRQRRPGSRGAGVFSPGHEGPTCEYAYSGIP